MKRLLCVSLTMVLVLALLSGCNDPSSTDEDTVTIWAWDPSFNIAIMETAKKYYEQMNPDVKIEIVEMSKEDVEQKLHTTLASRTTEGLPDIVLIEDYNAQKYLASYPGYFADITDAFNFTDFAGYKQEFLHYDGKMYGLPFDSGVAGMFYRTDIFEEAGYSAQDLQDITWDRYLEIGLDVKEKTGHNLLGMDRTDGGFMRIMMQSSGQWYFDGEGNSIVSSSPVVREAMETYKKIVDSGVMKPTNGWNEWVSAINSGEVATMTSGVWIVGSIKEAEDQSGLWDVAPVPRLNHADSKNASNLGGSSWFVLENAAGKAAAIEFLQAVYGADTGFYQDILTNNGAIGSYLPAHSGDAYNSADPFFGDNAIYLDLSDWITKIPSVNYGSYTYEADAAIMAQMDAYCAGNITIDEALEQAEAHLANQLQ